MYITCVCVYTYICVCYVYFSCGSDGKESTCNVWDPPRFSPWVGKIPWRRKWLPTPVFLPREFQGQKSLAGCSPWGHKESGMTEQFHFPSFFLIHNIKFYLFKCIVLWLAYLTMSSRFIHVWHLSDFLSFIKLNNIPFFVYTTFCLSIYPSTNTLVVSTFCQLWTECYRNECTSIWIRVFNFGVHS